MFDAIKDAPMAHHVSEPSAKKKSCDADTSSFFSCTPSNHNWLQLQSTQRK